MSKELEALKNVIKYCEYQYCDEELYIIETALNKLEGLEKIYKVARDYEEELTKNRDYWRDEAYKKQLKALAIIKEKRVDVGWLISCENIGQYNNVIGTATHKLLTQEEYDLLKEVLL